MAFQKAGSRVENNGVAHWRTTCSWAKERAIGAPAHRRVQMEERMERLRNAESHKQNRVVDEEGYGSRYCTMPLGDAHSKKQLDGHFQQSSSELDE